MIINKTLLISFIAEWINKQSINKPSILINYLNDQASILTSYICLKTKSKIYSTQNNPLNIISRSCADIKDILDFAEKNNAIIVSPISATKGKLARYHKKYNELGDIYPIYQLLDSDIEQLIKEELPDLYVKEPYEEIEWAMKEDSITNIISSDIPPQQNKFWYRYTMKQKSLISKLYYREKDTRHKSLDSQIYCKIPDNIYKSSL